MTAPTPRCDHLARELARPTSGPFMGAGNDSHKIIDWIALAQALERELAAARISISDGVSERQRLHGLLREMKAAMLGYPLSMRAMTPTTLLQAINAELREPEAPK